MKLTPRLSLHFWENYSLKEKIVLISALRYSLALGVFIVIVYSWFQEWRLKQAIGLLDLPSLIWVSGQYGKLEAILAIFFGIVCYNTIGVLYVRRTPLVPLAVVLSILDIITTTILVNAMVSYNQVSIFYKVFIVVLWGNLLFLGIPTLAVLFGRKASLFAVAFFFVAQALLYLFLSHFSAQVPTILIFIQMLFFTILAYIIGYISEVEQMHQQKAESLGLLEKALRFEKEILVEELEKANDAKRQFLAFASHELRTPLHAIMGYTRCILDGLDGAVNDKQAGDLNKISFNSNYLLSLINDLLDLSAIDAGKLELNLEYFYIEDCIREVEEVVAPFCAKKGLSIATKFQKEMPLINGDFLRIKQVLLNLVENAMKFTQKGGITVSVSCEQGELKIVVSDTGAGISPGILPYIFDEYRKSKIPDSPQYTGRGLGLAIVKQLIKMHNGSISVESKEGEGSSFYVRIPLDSS